ncbi:MAG: M67 family metallopeptidase [Chloroflexota bacterium]
MTFSLTEAVHSEITSHAEAGYPNEICGILLGKDGDGGRVIKSAMRIENSFEADEQYHRFLITPDDMFRAERQARREGLDVLGVYHSHPNEEARPSEYDRDHAAWTGWSYIIVSVRQGKSAGMRGWKLREDRSGFDEEEIAVV